MAGDHVGFADSPYSGACGSLNIVFPFHNKDPPLQCEFDGRLMSGHLQGCRPCTDGRQGVVLYSSLFTDPNRLIPSCLRSRKMFGWTSRRTQAQPATESRSPPRECVVCILRATVLLLFCLLPQSTHHDFSQHLSVGATTFHEIRATLPFRAPPRVARWHDYVPRA